MHTFADLAKALNRSTVYLSGLQSRFELPTFDGAGYSEPYLAFLQTVVHLRTFSITEETLRDLCIRQFPPRWIEMASETSEMIKSDVYGHDIDCIEAGRAGPGAHAGGAA